MLDGEGVFELATTSQSEGEDTGIDPHWHRESSMVYDDTIYTHYCRETHAYTCSRQFSVEHLGTREGAYYALSDGERGHCPSSGIFGTSIIVEQ